MEVYWMNYLSYLRPESKNELYLFRYLKFIEHCKTQIIKKTYTPKSITYFQGRYSLNI